MRAAIFCLLVISPVACWAEPEADELQAQEPTLHDHFLTLKRMQESLAGRSLEEQARMQPQMQKAERKACERLRLERKERVSRERYRQQGGDQFLVFALQFEQYCETLR